MNGQWKNIGSYLLVFALLCALLVFFENRSIENSTDSYQTFVQRLEEGQIAYAEIEPNEETPTGSVNYTLEDGSVRITHVLNTVSVEALLEDAGVAYATDQIIDLLSAGVQGIHLYIMNNARVARRITENIKPILDRINGEDRS